MSEEFYLASIIKDTEAAEAASKKFPEPSDLVYDADEESFYTTREMLNDFLLVTLASPDQKYPEDEVDEYIQKLCPFDGVMPHMEASQTEGGAFTSYDEKHSTLQSLGSDLNTYTLAYND